MMSEGQEWEPPNPTLDRTAGPHSLAAAGHGAGSAADIGFRRAVSDGVVVSGRHPKLVPRRRMRIDLDVPVRGKHDV